MSSRNQSAQNQQHKPLQVSTVQYKNSIYFGQHTDNKPNGLGLILFDSGSFALAEWKNGYINGKYFFYQNLLFTRNAQYTGCYYGKMINKKLQGFNYVQSINQNALQGQFINGKLQGQFLLQKFNSQVHFLFQQSKLVQESKIRKYKDHNNNRVSLNKQNNINSKTALQFLKSMVLDIQFKENTLQNFIVSKNMSQTQIFFGQLNQQGNQALGFIFRNGWPYISGKFKDNKLNGIGTVYETQNHILQGQFQFGHLKQGVLFDFQFKKSHYGNRKQVKCNLYSEQLNGSTNTKSLYQSQKFNIKQTVNRIDNAEILQFRRQKHLKSLCFVNNFKTQDDFASKWPTNLLQKVFHQQVINGLLQHLAPSYLSQIERHPQTSQNRVQRDLLQIFNESEQKQSKKRQQEYHKVSQQLNQYLHISRMKKNNERNYKMLIQQNYQAKRQDKKQESNNRSVQPVNRKLQYMTPNKASQLIQNTIQKKKKRNVVEQSRSKKKSLDLHKIYQLYLKK